MSATTTSAAPARRVPAPTRRRGPALYVALLALVVLMCFASLVWGVREIGLATVWQALVDPVAGDNDMSVVREQRVPRTLLGLLAGAALGLAGALLQGLTRNPIADPGLLGVNSGASLAVVLAIAVLGISDLHGFVWFAYLGAGVATLVVYGAASLGWEGPTPVRLALLGAAVTASTTALIMLVLTHRPLGARRVPVLVGRLPGQPRPRAGPHRRPRPARGGRAGAGLGPLPQRDGARRRRRARARAARRPGTVARGARGGAAVRVGAIALVGPIAFVGLVVPHVARALVGPDYRRILPVLGPARPAAAARRRRGRAARGAAQRARGRAHGGRRGRAGAGLAGAAHAGGVDVSLLERTHPAPDAHPRRGRPHRATPRRTPYDDHARAGRARRGHAPPSPSTRGDLGLEPGRLLAVAHRQRRATSTCCAWSSGCPGCCWACWSALALGTAGALFQSVLRNPLASPDVIGVSQGASVGAVLAVTAVARHRAARDVRRARRRAGRRPLTVRCWPGAAGSAGSGSCCAASASPSCARASSATC